MLYDDKVRPISISIIRNNNDVLVYERQDDITGEKFYRLVGGCIEFFEEASVALKREFFEELSTSIIDITLLNDKYDIKCAYGYAASVPLYMCVNALKNPKTNNLR